MGIDGGPELTALAATVDEKLARLAIPKEEHVFNPHLTLARRGGGSGSPRKQKGRPSEPRPSALAGETGGFAFAGVWYHDGPRVFSLPESAFARGSKYTKLAAFVLR